MARKIVGVTCSSSSTDERPRQYLNTAYATAIIEAGATPVIIPNILDGAAIAEFADVIDGLLLSGGVDVHPSHFGQDPHARLGTVDADRDRTELALIKLATETDMPVFGICRGIQVLNVALGGTLYQHLPDEAPGEIHHQQEDIKIPRDQFSHTISVHRGTRLSSIVGAAEMQTNSFHHQALRSVAPDLKIAAVAPDGVIEAVEAPDRKFMVAVQFHPEETAPVDERSRRLFEAFVNAL